MVEDQDQTDEARVTRCYFHTLSEHYTRAVLVARAILSGTNVIAKEWMRLLTLATRNLLVKLMRSAPALNDLNGCWQQEFCSGG